MQKIFITVLFFLGILISPQISFSAENFSTFTITPPLIKNNMKPGEEFVSGVKVINNNNHELVVYARVANFKSVDNGRVEFASAEDETGAYTLKDWITLPQESFAIAPFESKNIPYIINTPEDASPGGHYAGILIGTAPPVSEKGGTTMGISQIIASHIFVSIEGDILEKGYIRQFSVDKTVNNNDTVEFDVKFENTGNVHLKPVGNIRIYDIFDKEKGYISINHKTDFGNVLPDSERRWRLTWTALDDFVLLNRYKAVLTFGFGDRAKQTDFRETFFWLINMKLLFIVIGSFIAFFAILFLFIKLYIRQSVKNIEKQIERHKRRVSRRAIKQPKKKRPERKVVDLRHRKH